MRRTQIGTAIPKRECYVQRPDARDHRVVKDAHMINSYLEHVIHFKNNISSQTGTCTGYVCYNELLTIYTVSFLGQFLRFSLGSSSDGS
jgi:hypothetical protein